MYDPSKGIMKVAAFMSGSGTNLRRLIENKNGYDVTLIFTDNKDSNAERIGNEHGIPVHCRDIKEYYRERNASRRDMEVRKEYDAETAALLKQNNVDVVALCGYMSIVTEPVLDAFTVLNVHPADLRVLENEKRRYAGCMGADCVRKALEKGDELRSSVHIVTLGVDEGPVLAVSEPLQDVEGKSAEELQEELKQKGDWVVYPQVLQDMAAGKYRREGSSIYKEGELVGN